MKIFKVHVYLESDVDVLEDFEANATFIVMAKDEGRAETLVKEYIKKENLMKGYIEIEDVEEVPIDEEKVLGMIVD